MRQKEKNRVPFLFGLPANPDDEIKNEEVTICSCDGDQHRENALSMFADSLDIHDQAKAVAFKTLSLLKGIPENEGMFSVNFEQMIGALESAFMGVKRAHSRRSRPETAEELLHLATLAFGFFEEANHYDIRNEDNGEGYALWLKAKFGDKIVDYVNRELAGKDRSERRRRAPAETIGTAPRVRSPHLEKDPRLN